MQVLELKQKSKFEWVDVTVGIVAEDIMDLMRSHIGKKNAITRVKMFEKVYGLKRSEMKELNQFILTDMLHRSISKLRRRSNCFVVAELIGEDWSYYVPTTREEANVYKKQADKRIKSLKELKARADKSIEEAWHIQSWRIQ